MRDVLYLPALVAMGRNPDLKARFEALRAAGRRAVVAFVEKTSPTPVSGDMVGPMFRKRNIYAQGSVRLGLSEPGFEPVAEIIVHGRPGEAQRALSFGQEETGADLADGILFAGRRLRRLGDGRPRAA